MGKNTIVRGMLVPSLKNKPLDGRQDVPTLADIKDIENPYVNFIFPVAETGKWYKVTSLKTKVIDELEIPNGEVDGYELFGEGLTEAEKEALLTKELAEQTYISKDDASKDYQPKGDYATKKDLDGFLTEEDLGDLGNFATKEDLEGLGDVSYTEIGDIDFDDLFDQEGMDTADVGDAPAIDFDSLT